MKAKQALQLAKEQIATGDYDAALKLLEQLDAAKPREPMILWHKMLALEGLKQYPQARQVVDTLIELKPQKPDYWIRRAELHEGKEADKEAILDIERGLTRHRKQRALLLAKVNLLSRLDRDEEAIRLITGMIANAPEDLELLSTRAGLYVDKACEDESSEATITDVYGMHYARDILEAAAKDYSTIIAIDGSWRHILQRAKLYKQLGEYSKAVQDYDKVLALMGKDHALRQHVEHQRKACERGGGNERERIVKMMENAARNATGGRRGSASKHVADAAIQAAADQIRAGSDIPSALQAFVSDDPDELAATAVACDIYNQGNEPEIVLRKVPPGEHDPASRRFCDKVEHIVGHFDFLSLGDYEISHLIASSGRRTIARLFLSKDGKTCASAFRFEPLWPGFAGWLSAIMRGKWKKPKIVDFCSEFTDGRFLLTNNSDQLSLISAGPNVLNRAMPAKTAVDDLIEIHYETLSLLRSNSPGLETKEMHDFAELLEMKDRLRQCKNAFRRSVGYASEDELREILGRQYDKLAPLIRARLKKMAEAG